MNTMEQDCYGRPNANKRVAAVYNLQTCVWYFKQINVMLAHSTKSAAMTLEMLTTVVHHAVSMATLVLGAAHFLKQKLLMILSNAAQPIEPGPAFKIKQHHASKVFAALAAFSMSETCVLCANLDGPCTLRFPFRCRSGEGPGPF